jgi:hypothetical protein
MSTAELAKQALWNKSGLLQVQDPNGPEGYVKDGRLNLVPGVTPEMIKADYCRGSGHEWLKKFKAIHSSAALVANTFGRWKTDPRRLKVLGLSGFTQPELEAPCPTGLRGTPPNLDVLLQSSDAVIGIESKLLEPLKPTKPHFSPSYSRDRLPQCEDCWWNLLAQVRDGPPAHLDIAQLVKHYLGLRKQFAAGQKVYLLYLYWKPLNSAAINEYSELAKEIDCFRSAISEDSAVQFISMDYLQLWNSWSGDAELSQHAHLLKQRYGVNI